jgi:hypothetical protein
VSSTLKVAEPTYDSSWSIRPPRPHPTCVSSPSRAQLIRHARELPLADLVMSGAAGGSAATAEARQVLHACLAELGATDGLLAERRAFHALSEDDVAHLAGGTPAEVARVLGRVLASLGHRIDGSGSAPHDQVAT